MAAYRSPPLASRRYDDDGRPVVALKTGAMRQPEEALFGVESPAYVAIRWLQYGALLAVIGVVAFPLFVLPRLRRDASGIEFPDLHGQIARMGLFATLLLGASALMRLLAQSYALHGATLTPDVAMLGTLLRVTLWGHAWLLEVVAILIALVVLARARTRQRGAWLLLAVTAGAMAVAMALSGHAAAATTPLRLAVISDALHVVGAGGWLGGLLVLLIVGVPAARRVAAPAQWRAVGRLVNAFSPTALVFAGLTAITGVFGAWLHISSVAELWETRYGQVLLLKLAVLSVTAGVGFYNWRRVQPMLATDPAATRRLQRGATAELCIGLVVILVTAVLVATPTGKDM